MPQITVHRSFGPQPPGVQSAPLMGPTCAHLDLKRCESLYAGGSKSDALVQLRGYPLVAHGDDHRLRLERAYRYFEIGRFVLQGTTMRTIVDLDHVRFHITHTTGDI